MKNKVEKVIEDFGNEWTSYPQEDISEAELRNSFDDYFRIVDLSALPEGSVAADIGCGSGRWAKLVAPHVGTLYCVEPSSAIEVARRNLADARNVRFIASDLESMPIDDASLDFLYCLGVLHHVPAPQAGISSCAAKLKPGGRMLAYVYYRFDFQPVWFRALWRVSDLARWPISRLPHRLKLATTRLIAALVYLPLARLSGLFEHLGADVTNFPLSYYRGRSLYAMKTDALDRFGTVLEHRFTQPEIRAMFERAGFEEIAFSPDKPYWCVTAVKAG
ncbi:MAG: class I SAM-dependent methyltransferase [Paracoccaceae bacterium]